MKAWEIRNGKLDMHDVPPERPSSTQTLIQVSHSGLCGSDLPKLRHPSNFTLPEPWRPGHEIIGTDPNRQPVAVDPLIPCDACARCAAGDTHLCPNLRRIGWDLPGGFAEKVAVPAANAHPLPEDLDPLHAVLCDPAAVAIHGLRCNPTGVPGRLAVVGAGTVGMLTALYAIQQTWEVTVVDREGRTPHETAAEAVPAAFHSPSTLPHAEKTFDVVVDAATGADPAPIELAVRLVRDGGTIIVQNAYQPGLQLSTPLRDVFGRSIRLAGSFSHCRHRQPHDFTLAMNLLRDHTTQVASLVAQTGQLTDLPTVLGSQLRRSVRQVHGVHTPAR